MSEEVLATPEPPQAPPWQPKLFSAADLLAPFTGSEGPAGEDLLFSNVYGQLKELARSDEEAVLFKEGDKFKPKEGWKSADWRAVEKLTLEVLGKRAKDLRVAGYLARALANRAGLQGMREGLWLLTELQDKLWDCLQPVPDKIKRPDGTKVFDSTLRLGEMSEVFEEFAKKMAGLGGATGSESEEKVATLLVDIDGFGAELNRFHEALDERMLRKTAEKESELQKAFDTHAASFHAVRDEHARRRAEAIAAGERQKLEAEEAARRAEEDAKATAQRAIEEEERRKREEAELAAALASLGMGGDGATAAATAPISGERGPAVMGAVRSGTLLRQLDPNDAVAYRLMFLPLWDAGNCRGTVDGPPKQVRDLLPKLHADGNLQLLGDAVAKAMYLPAARDWLDLAWYLSVVLGALGDNAKAALSGLQEMLGQRLSREPGWPGASFADGSPMARDEAKAWAAEVDSAFRKQAKGGSGETGIPQKDLEEAVRLAESGRVQDAVESLQGLVETARSAREQFLRRLDFAEFCAAHEAGALADVTFRRLLAQVQERGLESWEGPRLLARIYEGLYHRSKSGSAECAELGASALEKLRFLDPRRALETGG